MKTKQCYEVTISVEPDEAGNAQFKEIGEYKSLAPAVILAANEARKNKTHSYIGLTEKECDEYTGEEEAVGYYGATIMDYCVEYGWSFYSPPKD